LRETLIALLAQALVADVAGRHNKTELSQAGASVDGIMPRDDDASSPSTTPSEKP
jgi:hypothetical protein